MSRARLDKASLAIDQAVLLIQQAQDMLLIKDGKDRRLDAHRKLNEAVRRLDDGQRSIANSSAMRTKALRTARTLQTPDGFGSAGGPGSISSLAGAAQATGDR